MSIRAFFESAALAPGLAVTLDPDESHYLVRVRRIRPGRPIEVLDGHGGRWRATVDRPDPEACQCTVNERIETTSPRRSLTLLLGYPDPRATLNVLALCTELAVEHVVLVRCCHSHTSPPSRQRIDRTLRAAQRQCGRPMPPTVRGPVPFESAIQGVDPGSGFFASERHAGTDTAVTLKPGAPALLVVGPEGGLAEAEADQLVTLSFRPMSLGSWILRTETAVVAGLTRLWWA